MLSAKIIPTDQIAVLIILVRVCDSCGETWSIQAEERVEFREAQRMPFQIGNSIPDRIRLFGVLDQVLDARDIVFAQDGAI